MDHPHPRFNVWERDAEELSPPKGVYREKFYQFGRFDECIAKNVGLDWTTKRAALEASRFVVSLKSYTGSQLLFMCSGIIVDSKATEGNFSSTILTFASLLECPTQHAVAANIKVDVYLADGSICEGNIEAYDFHYNIAEILVKSSNCLQMAIIGNIDGTNQVLVERGGSRSFQLVSHRDTTVNLLSEMPVIALGRFCDHPYHIMAAPGILKLVDSGLDCEELLMTDCEITKNGIGGPIISSSGCVIGMSFYKSPHTPFLPINIALKCLEHLQRYRKIPRPWLGVKLSDLHSVGLDQLAFLEKLNQSFPKLVEGVIVTQVISASPASRAGIRTGDMIIELDDKPVRRTFTFQCLMLDRADKWVKVIIKRMGHTEPLTLKLCSQLPREVNRWPLSEEYSYRPIH